MAPEPHDLVIGGSALTGTETGIGVYARAILRHLPDALPDTRLKYLGARGQISEHQPAPSPTQSPPADRSWRQALGDLPILGPPCRTLWHRYQAARIPRRSALYWEPNNILDPRANALFQIATIHDFSWRHHPEWHPQSRVAYFRQSYPYSIRSAHAIITGCPKIRDEIQADAPWMRPEDIHVIPHGIDHGLFTRPSNDDLQKFRQRRKLPESFILAVGTLEPRKNLITLLKAFASLGDSKKYLVIVGASGWRNSALHNAIEELGDRVMVLGYVPRNELPLLYGAAEAVAYPSLYEGFGLPPLEAAACGTPVWVSDHLPCIPYLRKSAVALPALNQEAWRNAMINSPVCQHQVKLPTWEASAHAHAQVFSLGIKSIDSTPHLYHPQA